MAITPYRIVYARTWNFLYKQKKYLLAAITEDTDVKLFTYSYKVYA